MKKKQSPECLKCIHMDKYVLSTNTDIEILTCTGLGWEEGDDGEQIIYEISDFDESECLLFLLKFLKAEEVEP